MQKEDIVFLVTGAHDIKSATDTLLRERYLEYMIALQKIFLYNKPTYGVLSEYNEKRNHIPPFNIFSFNKYVKLLPIDLRICTTKSQQEFYSIQILIKDMDLNHKYLFNETLICHKDQWYENGLGIFPKKEEYTYATHFGPDKRRALDESHGYYVECKQNILGTFYKLFPDLSKNVLSLLNNGHI